MTSIPLHTRTAEERDAPALAKLSAELGYDSSVETMRHRIHEISNSPADLLLIAVDASNEPIGCIQAHLAHIWESGPRVEIVGMIVAQDWRRRGVGRLLVANAEHWAQNTEARAIVVRSNVQREESHRFYESLGYAKTKLQQVYRKELRGNSD